MLAAGGIVTVASIDNGFFYQPSPAGVNAFDYVEQKSFFDSTKSNALTPLRSL
jgi:hypothetical protein